MDRTFDYSQKILLAVEFGAAPQPLADMPPSYALFQRLAIPEVTRAFEESESLFVRLIAGRKFHHVLDRHMGYWEQHIPAGQLAFVHYAIGDAARIDDTLRRLRSEGRAFVLLGTYEVEPQASAYPFAFPTRPAPDHWHPDEPRGFDRESIFWFNFFPAQKQLFEKTFVVWALFQLFQGREGGECNQLVRKDSSALHVQGVDEFVLVNLNRFSSLPGFFNAAADAGKYSFTNDPDYTWYGMLLRKVG